MNNKRHGRGIKLSIPEQASDKVEINGEDRIENFCECIN